MENSISRIAEQGAEQRIIKSGTVKLWLLWLAVGLPLLWGVMKALEDVPYLFR
jgi:hypothetical protein